MIKKVIIYTGSNCVNCHSVKNYLTKKGINFEERDTSINEYRNELISMGYRSVPLIIIGEEKILGFNVDEIDKAINK